MIYVVTFSNSHLQFFDKRSIMRDNFGRRKQTFSIIWRFSLEKLKPLRNYHQKVRSLKLEWRVSDRKLIED